MRNLIILTGPRGSGKTGLARDLNLLPWHVDQASISRLYATPSLDEDGHLSCAPQPQRRAADFLLSAIRAKMDRSEFIVFEMSSNEGVIRSDQVLNDLLSQAERYRYATTLVDFGAETDEACRELPAIGPHGRKPYGRVVTPKGFADGIDRIKNPIVDISHADAIVAIGDIHGNARALETCLSQAQGRGRIAFIFCGDFINKGPEPARTLRLLTDFRKANPDCFLLSGNHEVMLENWAWRRGSNRDVFASDTLPDLHANQYSRKDARKFLTRLRDHVRLSWRGHDILVTHGGLSAPTDMPGFLPGHVKRMGVGQPGIDIDRVWERNGGGPRSIQIHGHRNLHQIDVDQSSRSFNLEGIDAFGQMRGLVLRPDGDGIKAQGFSLPISPETRRRKKRVS